MTIYYKVTRYFTDLQDNDHAYNAGDTFPREGMEVSKARIEELAGSSNKQGRPLIEAVEVVEDVVPVQEDFSLYMNAPTSTIDPSKYDYSKHEINRMSTARLRELGAELGIEKAEEKTGGALKPLIIKTLGL